MINKDPQIAGDLAQYTADFFAGSGFIDIYFCVCMYTRARVYIRVCAQRYKLSIKKEMKH